jgi:hypothetical protein
MGESEAWESLLALMRFWEARRRRRPILGTCGSGDCGGRKRASRREAAEEFEVGASTAIVCGAGARGRGPSASALDARTGRV